MAINEIDKYRTGRTATTPTSDEVETLARQMQEEGMNYQSASEYIDGLIRSGSGSGQTIKRQILSKFTPEKEEIVSEEVAKAKPKVTSSEQANTKNLQDKHDEYFKDEDDEPKAEPEVDSKVEPLIVVDPMPKKDRTFEPVDLIPTGEPVDLQPKG
jgi:hypothetical protein